MKLGSVLGKVRGGTKVTVYDYLSQEVYINRAVEDVLDNSAYHKLYREAQVYGIDTDGAGGLEIRILLDE